MNPDTLRGATVAERVAETLITSRQVYVEETDLVFTEGVAHVQLFDECERAYVGAEREVVSPWVGRGDNFISEVVGLNLADAHVQSRVLLRQVLPTSRGGTSECDYHNERRKRLLTDPSCHHYRPHVQRTRMRETVMLHVLAVCGQGPLYADSP